MDLDAEKKSQDIFVARQDEIFTRMLDEARQGRIKEGVSRQEILERYGPGVLEKRSDSLRTQETGRTLMYRYLTDFMGSPKVYLDFNADDRLVAVRVQESI